MKRTKKNKPLNWLQRLAAATVEKGIFREDESIYDYLILKKEFLSALPNFTGFHLGTILISEEIPEEYRPYIFAHEIFCHVVFRNQKGGCVAALKKELERVPEEMRSGYLTFRLEQYRNLVQYYATAKNESFKEEIIGALALLEELAAKT